MSYPYQKLLYKLGTYWPWPGRAIYRDTAALSTPIDRDALSLEEARSGAASVPSS